MGDPPLQVVDKDGVFNKNGLEGFVEECGLNKAGSKYQVVSIMGPQSSGKSTLLNHLFGTGFRMMDAELGRSQTTQGIWLSRADKMDNCTLVLDLEGSDGRERGEDDTAFERQAALFALAVSDVLIINIWHHDIGREQGAGKPLMRTVLQVHLRLMKEDNKKTVLLFVVRDKVKKTPMSALEATLGEDLLRIWDSVSKPAEIADRHLNDFFDVKYTSLPSFEERVEEFKAEVVVMRSRFDPDHENCVVKPESKLPGSVFALSAERLWDVVHSHKDLNLPAHKVMVANIRCKEILSDKLKKLKDDQAWEGLCTEADTAVVAGFGSRLSGLLDSCLSGYDEEAQYFDTNVRREKRQDLLAALRDMAAPLVTEQHEKLRKAVMKLLNSRLEEMLARDKSFSSAAGAALKEASEFLSQTGRDMRVSVENVNIFEEEEVCTAKKIKEDMKDSVEGLRSEKVGEIIARCKAKAQASLGEVTEGLLEDMPPKVWGAIRSAIDTQKNLAKASIESQIKGFAPRENEVAEAVKKIEAQLREDVERRIRETAARAVSSMRESFNRAFNFDSSGIPRVWGVRDNIPKITGDARNAAAVTLAQLAVLRLDDAVEQSASNVQPMLLASLLEQDSNASGDAGDARKTLSMSAWPDVPKEAVILQPPACRSLWRQFRTETDFALSNAINTQQAHQMASNRMPPLWALLAIAFFGMDEFISILYNPVFLLLGIALFLFARQLYLELDVDTEMQKGALPGMISLSVKAMPVLRKVSMSTAEAVTKLVTGDDGLVARATAGLSPHRPAMSPAESNVEMSRLDDREEGSDGLRHRGSRPVSAPSMNRGGISSAQHEQDPKDM